MHCVVFAKLALGQVCAGTWTSGVWYNVGFILLGDGTILAIFCQNYAKVYSLCPNIRHSNIFGESIFFIFDQIFRENNKSL